VHWKEFEFEYASWLWAISRQVVTASAEESKRGGEWAWLLLNTLGHGGGCTALVSELSCVCCSCATDAVRRAAARLFVQDAKRGMRLPESGYRLRLDPVSGNCMPLWAYWTNSLAAGRQKRRSRNCNKHATVHLLHAMHSPPCPNLYRIRFTGHGWLLSGEFYSHTHHMTPVVGESLQCGVVTRNFCSLKFVINFAYFQISLLCVTFIVKCSFQSP